MGDDLYELELLSLVAKITQEIVNYTGINDKTLAEFVISLHDEAKSVQEFKQRLKDTGADFPDSFVENMDRLILSMHPKHKKRSTNGSTKVNGKQAGGIIDEKEKNRRLFPGLALPDQDWQPSTEKDIFMKEVDDMMAQLEGVQKKKNGIETGTERDLKYQRRSRSRSPRRSPSPSRGRRDDRYEDRRGRQRRQLDDRPVLYKIYDGRVSSLKDFGAFVTLEGVAGRVEGTLQRI